MAQQISSDFSLDLKERENEKTFYEQLIDKHKKYIFAAFALSPFIAFLPISPIVYMRTVFGPVINSDSISYLMWLFLLLVFALVINGILEWIRDRILLAGGLSFCSELEACVYSHTLEKKNNAWRESQLINNNLRVVRNFLKSPIAGAFFDAPFSAVLLLVIFYIHPLMGFCSLLGMLMAFIIGIMIEKKVAPDAQKAQDAMARSRTTVDSYFKNIFSSTTMGTLPKLKDKWINIHKEFLVYQGKASSIQALGAGISTNVMMIQGSLVLGIGAFLMLTGLLDRNSAGMLIIAKFIGALAIRPTMMIVMSWNQVVTFRTSLLSLKNLIQNYSKDSSERIKLPKPTGSLRATNVSLKQMNSERNIIQGVNISLPKGNIAIVLGESGAGKTTIGKILCGIIPPSTGTVRLDGVEISDWDKNELSPHIGYLPQSIDLFAGRVSQNISRFRSIDKDKLKKVCEIFQLSNEYSAFENNVEVEMNSDGYSIPGGLRQKIGLARAFYGDPNYIVLDEPTSNLDSIGEEGLIRAIHEYKKNGSSIIIITHNAKLLKLADYLLIIKQGKQRYYEKKGVVYSKLRGETKQK